VPPLELLAGIQSTVVIEKGGMPTRCDAWSGKVMQCPATGVHDGYSVLSGYTPDIATRRARCSRHHSLLVS
jgi:hypothetical protein